MTTHTQPAGHDELVAFLEKLGQFHSTLSPHEQEMLNEMTMAALTAGGDVQGYGTGPTLSGILLQSPSAVGRPYYYPYYNALAQSLQAGVDGGGGVGIR